MVKIDEKEMKSVCGGGWLLTIGHITAIIFGATFITGVFDGFLRPLRCN